MKELRNLEFTIEEYLKSPVAVLNRAMALIESQSLTQREVRQYLEGRCRQMMMDSFSWDESICPVVGSGFISCHVGGHKVEFFVRVAPRQMSVSLLRDGTVDMRSIEIDPLSAAVFTEDPYGSSPISEYGLQKAKSLAADLYYRK